MEEQVIEHFHRSIQAKMAVGEQLAPTVAAAAQSLSETFLNGGKLWIAGFGASQHLAAHIHYCLSHGLNFERPTLPVLLLNDTPGPFVNPDRLDGQIYSRQLNALADSGDVLLVVSPGDNPEPLTQAITAAHSRNATSIVLTGPGDSLLTTQLNANDIELSSGANNQLRNQEIQLLIIFCLCELIEQQFFGGSAP